MIHWIDESIVYSVLSGLSLLGAFLLLWIGYIRLWQLSLWQHCESVVSHLEGVGFTLKQASFTPMFFVEDAHGNQLQWRGGLFGEHSQWKGQRILLVTRIDVVDRMLQEHSATEVNVTP